MALSGNKSALARKLGICRQSLYYHPKKPKEDEAIKVRIQAVLAEHAAYGHRRVAGELEFNHKRIARIMKLFGLRPRLMRGRPAKANDRGRPPTGIPNLAKTICPIAPNVLWAGDFTYLPWEGSFVYLATVIDVYTREIVGWHVGLRHTTDLVIQAFLDAYRRTGSAPQIFHSDQGSEYVSGQYEKLLENLSVKASQSSKGSPWQNGYQESFYNQFKLELGHPKCYDDLGQLVEAIAQQLRYYNTRRIHSALKMPPALFRAKQEYKKTTRKVAPQSLIYKLINPSKTRNTV